MTIKKVTTNSLLGLKSRDERAVFLTAYDYPTAVFADRAGADMLLVGDSAAMTMLGLRPPSASRWTRCSVSRGQSAAAPSAPSSSATCRFSRTSRRTATPCATRARSSRPAATP
jgi:hypothetical protein